MKSYAKAFQNLDAFTTYLKNTEFNPMFKSKYARSSEEEGGFDFRGTYSFEEAEGLLTGGDRKNAAKLTAAGGAKINAPGESVRVRRFSAVAGGSANVPAAVLGLPKSMYKTQKIAVNGSKVLNICYSANAGSNVDAYELLDTSIEITKAILRLEKSGYRVNLYIGFATTAGDERAAAFVKIKDSGQYMDITKMAYPLVNPSMKRRHYFRFIETLPADFKSKSFSRCYGYPVLDNAVISECAKEAGLNLKKIITFYEMRGKSCDEIVSELSK